MNHTCTACHRRSEDPARICLTCWSSGVRTHDGAVTNVSGQQVKRWADLDAGDLVQITADRVATVATARRIDERAEVTLNETGGNTATLTNAATASIRLAASTTTVMGLKARTAHVRPGTWTVRIGGLRDEFTADTLTGAVWQAAAVVAQRTGWPTTDIRVGQISGDEFVVTVSTATA